MTRNILDRVPLTFHRKQAITSLAALSAAKQFVEQRAAYILTRSNTVGTVEEINLDSFVITTSANPTDELLYETLNDQPHDMSKLDGGFF